MIAAENTGNTQALHRNCGLTREPRHWPPRVSLPTNAGRGDVALGTFRKNSSYFCMKPKV